MATTESASAIAEQIRKERIGSKIGVLSFWGILPVQPNDTDYELKAVKADGDKLELTLEGYDQTTLSIWKPQGFKSARDSLQFKSASRVAWTFGNWDLHVEGGTLHVRGGASTDEGTRPVDPKAPAVSLKRA